MKYLPCLGRCRGLPALATKAGLLYSAGQLFGSAYSYVCVRCGRRSTITSAEFVRLPSMTPAQIADKTSDMPYTKPQDVPVEERRKALVEEPPAEVTSPIPSGISGSAPNLKQTPQKPKKKAKAKAKPKPKPKPRRRP